MSSFVHRNQPVYDFDFRPMAWLALIGLIACVIGVPVIVWHVIWWIINHVRIV